MESKSTSRRPEVGAVADAGATSKRGRRGQMFGHSQGRRDEFQACRLVGHEQGIEGKPAQLIDLRGERRGARQIGDMRDQRAAPGRQGILEGAGQSFARGAVRPQHDEAACAQGQRPLRQRDGARLGRMDELECGGAGARRMFVEQQKGHAIARGQFDAARIKRAQQADDRILTRQRPGRRAHPAVPARSAGAAASRTKR